MSLNRSLLLPRIDNESDEEVNIDEADVRELQQQLDKLRKSCEEMVRDQSCDGDSTQMAESCDTDLMSEDDVDSPEETEIEEINLEKSENELLQKENTALTDDIRGSPNSLMAINSDFRSSISVSSRKPAILQEPTLSESPKIGKNLRKSAVITSSYSVAANNATENSNNKSELRQSLGQSEYIRSSLRSSKIFPGPAESLAASLQRGLDIIDHHQRSSATNKSSVSFSFEHLTLQPCPEVDKASSPEKTFLCASCRRQVHKKDSDEVEDSLKTWIVPVNEAGNSEQIKDEAKKVPIKLVTKRLNFCSKYHLFTYSFPFLFPHQDVKNITEEVAKGEELEKRYMEQAAKIEQLNQLVIFYFFFV